MADRILIYPLPLTNEARTVFATAKKDKELIEAINKKKEQLVEKGVEIFNQVDNIIVTEEGYFAAFFNNDAP